MIKECDDCGNSAECSRCDCSECRRGTLWLCPYCVNGITEEGAPTLQYEDAICKSCCDNHQKRTDAKDELKQRGLMGSVGYLSEVAGGPPQFPQACKVRIAEDCYEDATLVGLDEEGSIILRWPDGDEDTGVYGEEEIFV